MEVANLDYGRLDFLLADGIYWFLEVNANGEWDWLDSEGTNSVRRTIAHEIDPRTPIHPIPMTPYAPAQADSAEALPWTRHSCPDHVFGRLSWIDVINARLSICSRVQTGPIREERHS